MSSWIVQNKRGEQLVFDNSFKNEPIDLSLKNDVLDKYFQFGGVAQGDGKFSTRKISFKTDLIYREANSFRYNINRIVSFFNIIDEPFYLINSAYNVRCKVRLNSLKPNFKQGLEDLISIDTSIEFENLDGLFETNTPLEATNYSLVDQDEFEIQVSIEAMEASPIFTFTTSTGCNEFALLNKSTGESFRIQEAGFIAGSEIKVDCLDGLVYLNGNLKPLILNEGSFLKLRNGINTLIFQTSTVGIVDIKTEYRESFAY